MKIMACYDGTEAARDALDLAKKHARAFDGEVIVVYSLPGGNSTTSEEIDQANDELEKVKQEFDREEIRCDTKLLVRGLEPGEDIVEYAEEKAVDEIIIGIKHRSKVGKFLFGSNAQTVILKAPCPVVSIK